MSNPPTLAEFKEAVRNEFGYLARDFGFREVEPTLRDVEVNPFCVWFANATTLVEVEGINWGFGAQVILGRLHSDVEWHAKLPLWAIIKHARPDLYELEGSTGQLADISRAAALLREAASDVLNGDFTVLRGARSIIEAQVLEDRKRSQAEMREHNHRTAVAEAAHAFHSRDYRRVVDLLTPHEKLLSAAERAKLNYARSHLGDG